MNSTDSLSRSVIAGSTRSTTIVVRLADGDRVRLRAASDGNRDDDAFKRLFYSLSETTRYRYFCAGVPATETWAERFMLLGRTDGPWSSVLVAEVDGDLIGFACFRQRPQAAPDDHSADLGIVLTDAWQGRGLGGHMLTWLARAALCREITTFTADVLAENRRMVRLVRRIFPDVHTAYAFGSLTFTIDLESWQASLGERAAC